MLEQSELDRQNTRIRIEQAESVKNECMVGMRRKLEEIEKLKVNLTAYYNGLALEKQNFKDSATTLQDNVKFAARAIFFSRELLDVICEDMKRICADIGPALEDIERAQCRISDILGNNSRGLIRYITQELVSANSSLVHTQSDFQINLNMVPNSSNLEVLTQIARKASTNPIFKANLANELKGNEGLWQWFQAYTHKLGISLRSHDNEQTHAFENQSSSSVTLATGRGQSGEVQEERIRAVKREFASNMHPLIIQVQNNIENLQQQLERHKLYLNAHQNVVARPTANFNSYVRLIEAIVRLAAIYQNDVIPVFNQINQILKAMTKVLSEIRILSGCDLKNPETWGKARPHTDTLSKLATDLECQKLDLGDYASSISEPMFQLGQAYAKANPNDQTSIQQQLLQKGLLAWCQPWIDFFDNKNVSQVNPLITALQSISCEQPVQLPGLESTQFAM